MPRIFFFLTLIGLIGLMKLIFSHPRLLLLPNISEISEISNISVPKTNSLWLVGTHSRICPQAAAAHWFNKEAFEVQQGRLRGSSKEASRFNKEVHFVHLSWPLGPREEAHLVQRRGALRIGKLATCYSERNAAFFNKEASLVVSGSQLGSARKSSRFNKEGRIM